MNKTLRKSLARAACLAALFAFQTAITYAQEPKDQPEAAAAKQQAPARPDERAEAVLKRAVEALGGDAYLGVKTVVSRGHFTPFRDGQQLLPISFQDFMALPDRERTEFKGAGTNGVEAYVGGGGWVFDRKTKPPTLVDMKPEQAESFRLTMRTSVDNVLRGWWRSEGAALSYVGRREAGLARRNEVVRLKYPDGLEIEFEFDAKEGLPSKVLYKKQNAEGDTTEEEDRYAQFQTLGAVRFPLIVDHYSAGVQTSRVNYSEVEFNRPLPDALFTKPADIKAAEKSIK